MANSCMIHLHYSLDGDLDSDQERLVPSLISDDNNFNQALSRHHRAFNLMDKLLTCMLRIVPRNY